MVGGLLALVLCAATSRADTVTANLTSHYNDVYTVKVNGQEVSGYTGPYTWTKTAGSGSGGLGNSFQTYCVELLQETINPTTYTVVSVSKVPQPGVGAPENPAGSGMGNVRANLIAGLWGTFNSLVGTDADKGAAFQLAVWEFVYGDPSKGWNLTDSTSNFYVESGTDFSTVVPLAQQWINYVVAGKNVTMATNLIGLQSTTGQDQITSAVPAPPSVLLAGFGALGLLTGAWRRRKLSLS